MTTRKAFYDTTVAESKTRGEIDTLLRKHGVEAFRWTELRDGMVLEFKHPEGSFALSADFSVGDAPTPEKRRRQVMRALHWHIKAKFDAIDFGLEDMRRAFLPYMITAPNRTLIDDVTEAMDQRALGIDVPLLPEGR